jgi:hypothetical protein
MLEAIATDTKDLRRTGEMMEALICVQRLEFRKKGELRQEFLR